MSHLRDLYFIENIFDKSTKSILAYFAQLFRYKIGKYTDFYTWFTSKLVGLYATGGHNL